MTMTNVGDEFFREQLLERRERLAVVAARTGPAAELARLTREVDEALVRLERGSFGLCDVCHESVEKDRLFADPLTRFCLDHLDARQQQALSEDLQLAARVQRALLPAQNLRVGGWQAHYQYEPVGPVSGDYCDLIVSDGDSGDLFFLLGDVSGKGVAASMRMNQLHAMFRSLIRVEQPLQRLVEIANNIFCESGVSGQYATLVCGRAARSGEVELASAGHLPALHVRREGVAHLEATGFPLGMFRDSLYGVRKLRLEPAESLLLYTDGVTETRDAAQKEFGVPRLGALAKEGWALEPPALAAACISSVKSFSAGTPRSDDLTLLVLRRSGLSA
jgi:sigma-B regulation protein RsbU (phosphoserine phosphatase)